jgi:hypothetical protein
MFLIAQISILDTGEGSTVGQEWERAQHTEPTQEKAKESGGK